MGVPPQEDEGAVRRRTVSQSSMPGLIGAAAGTCWASSLWACPPNRTRRRSLAHRAIVIERARLYERRGRNFLDLFIVGMSLAAVIVVDQPSGVVRIMRAIRVVRLFGRLPGP